MTKNQNIGDSEMTKYQEIKEELKALAKKIKNTKKEYKEAQRANKWDTAWRIGNAVDNLKYEFRHRHIAMSIIRGRNRDEIERPGPYNLPNEQYIKLWVEKYEQALCPDA